MVSSDTGSAAEAALDMVSVGSYHVASVVDDFTKGLNIC